MDKKKVGFFIESETHEKFRTIAKYRKLPMSRMIELWIDTVFSVLEPQLKEKECLDNLLDGLAISKELSRN
jgi:hypothetical protein